MTTTWIYALASVTIVSLISLIGIVFISFRLQALQRIVSLLVSFAVGALLGNAILHLLPEAFHLIPNTGTIALLFLAGVLALFSLEKFLHWHHDHNLSPDAEPKIKTYGYISLLADGFHNFTDGILIGGAWLVSPEIGLATTLAIILHEVPQEISDFGVLIHAGFSKKKALRVNFFAALSAVAGAVLALWLGQTLDSFATHILPFAAGGFVYLACSDLIPELHKKNSTKNSLAQLAGIIAGVALMYLISTGHHHHHGHDHDPEHVHTEQCDH